MISLDFEKKNNTIIILIILFIVCVSVNSIFHRNVECITLLNNMHESLITTIFMFPAIQLFIIGPCRLSLKVKGTIMERIQKDSLTGLFSRNLFYDKSKKTISTSLKDKKIALFFIDLDNFKPINDKYGHKIGDLTLKEVARRLALCGRNKDILSRFGGDEFLYLFPELGSIDDAIAISIRLSETLTKELFCVDDKDIKISASIGVSIYPDDSMDIHGLIEKADLCMYKSKEKGCNLTTFYNSGD